MIGTQYSHGCSFLTGHAFLFLQTDEQVLWDLLNVNIASTTLMCRIVLPDMEARGRGAIINLASSAALNPQPLQASYTATKVRTSAAIFMVSTIEIVVYTQIRPVGSMT